MKTYPKKPSQAGFTLYELMIAVLIVGVILSFGITNLSEFTRNSRMTASANDLHAAFHLARSESAREKTNVTICPSAAPMAAVPACGGTWDQGYIVFTDIGAANAPGNLVFEPPNEAVIRRHGPVEEGVNLNFVGGATYFMYSATGLGRTDVAGTAVSQVIMCDDRGNETAAGGNSAARLFVVTPLGRATIVRDKTQIGAAGGCP